MAGDFMQQYLSLEKKVLTIATWNVNSVRVRLPQVLDFLEKHQPDCLALQETKVVDADFPKEMITKAGYHVIYTGQKTYNGVAILSKAPLEDCLTELPNVDPLERRFIAATLGTLRFINVYVPNGASVDSPKYSYKLDWFAKLRDYLQLQIQEYKQIVMMGDFNVAPTDADIAEPERWRGQVLASQPERDAFQALAQTGVVDLLEQRRDYTWWDYRAGAFPKNKGLRIDHILATPSLAGRLVEGGVDKERRGHTCPSDHAPLWARLNLN
ncbi:MAG: xth-2 [Gammaproteobacteria bacterium]|jgi:exodeoxyribonuclease-3|nr:xth-2 [Gammaproteobacteria bacterium]